MSEKLFNVGIKAVIVDNNKVLLLKHDAGFWDVPGGRMDADESIEETLNRELREELPNIKSFKVQNIVSATRIHKDIKPDVSLVLIFFRVTATFSGEPQISDEHVDYAWATKEEALKLVNDNFKSVINLAFTAQ